MPIHRRGFLTVDVTHDVSTSKVLANRESCGTHAGISQGMGDIVVWAAEIGSFPQTVFGLWIPDHSESLNHASGEDGYLSI